MNSKPKVLFIDDEEDLLRTIKIVLSSDFEVSISDNPIEALSLIQNESYDVIVSDISMPNMTGMEVLKRIKRINPLLEVIMLTALNDTQLAILAAKEGAYDFVTKPFDPDAMKIVIKRAYEKKCLLKEKHLLERKVNKLDEATFESIIGTSDSMREVFDLIKKVSVNDSPVLIQGETGTGKELVAKAIHNLSSRKDNPFIAVNCGAIPSELFESEFFGHEKGAFTGAISQKLGKFEAASGGTLFLDEVAMLPLDMQVKLLRVIQEQEICRVGSHTPIKVNVRLISACNESLKDKISRSEYREDLYHRIAVVDIDLPPLRRRQNDVAILSEYFLGQYNKKYNKAFASIEEDALRVFREYYWPGNVRELEHLIEKIVSLEEGGSIQSAFLPLEMYLKKVDLSEYEQSRYKSIMTDFEKSLIVAALRKCDNNQTQTSKYLGISRTTLISKMENLNLK